MVKKQQKKKKKLKLRVKVLFKLLLFVGLVAFSIYYAKELKIKNIYVTGNVNVKDVTVIETLGIQDYPKIYELNLDKMEKSLKKLPLVEKANIKRNIFGKLSIDIEETKILFLYKYNNKYTTASNKSIKDDLSYIGVPSLINFTPDTIFDALVVGLNKIDYESKLTFYSSGQEEKFEYTYEELLVGIELVFLEVEIPDFGDLNEGEQNTDIEKEEVIVVPDEDKNDATDTTKPEKHWEKPVVKSSELKANVYSLEGTIKISDPAGVIKKAPTYTMYVDNKVYSRRTFYGSGNIVIGGLTSETTYYNADGSKKHLRNNE